MTVSPPPSGVFDRWFALGALLSAAVLALWWWIAHRYGFAFWFVVGGFVVGWVRLERDRVLAHVSRSRGLLRAAGLRQRQFLRRRFRSVGEFGAAFVPLLFPLMIAGLYAAAGLPAWEQFVAGLAAGLAGWFVVHEEHARNEKVGAWFSRLANDIPALALGLLFVIGAGAAVSLPIVALEPAWVDAFQRVGGLATLIALFAVAAALVGVMIRLFAFLTSTIRIACVAGLLFIAAHGATILGVLPGYRFGKRLPSWVDAIVAAVLVGALLYDGVRSTPRASARSTASAGSLRARLWWSGFVVVLFASATFLVAVPYGVLSSTDNRASFHSAFGPVRPGMPHALPADNQALADAYAPVLQFGKREQWGLAKADDYIRDAAVFRVGGTHSYAIDRRHPADPHPTLATLPKACSDGGTLCFTLSCRDKESGCQKRTAHKPGPYKEGVEYARVLRRANTPKLFAPSTPFGERLTTLVQYWLFYRYDQWIATTVAGNLDQHHEADWEAVTVGFSARAPLFVAYSEHCGGRWFNWRDIQVEPVIFTADHQWRVIASAAQPALHPLVGVAEGSHANYLRAQDQRAPDWSSCGAHISQATAGALSYIWNIRDRTETTWTVFPAKVVRVNAHTPPMSFPGYWGASDSITLRNFRTPALRIGSKGDGPKAPPSQPLWYDPLGTIFCSEHWHPKRCKS